MIKKFVKLITRKIKTNNVCHQFIKSAQNQLIRLTQIFHICKGKNLVPKPSVQDEKTATREPNGRTWKIGQRWKRWWQWK